MNYGYTNIKKKDIKKKKNIKKNLKTFLIPDHIFLLKEVKRYFAVRTILEGNLNRNLIITITLLWY